MANNLLVTKDKIINLDAIAYAENVGNETSGPSVIIYLRVLQSRDNRMKAEDLGFNGPEAVAVWDNLTRIAAHKLQSA